MARFNEILAGRFNRALQKLTAIKGGPPAGQLANEITPNFQFNSMGVDFRYLEGWNRFFTSASSSAQAAINSAVRFRNPVGSNVIVVIEKLFFQLPAAATSYVLGIARAGTVGDFTNVFAGINEDSRTQAVGSVLSISGSVGATVNTGLTPWTFSVPVGAVTELILHEDHQLVLTPGDVMQIRDNTVNEAMLANLLWRERFLEDSERA